MVDKIHTMTTCSRVVSFVQSKMLSCDGSSPVHSKYMPRVNSKISSKKWVENESESEYRFVLGSSRLGRPGVESTKTVYSPFQFH